MAARSEVIVRSFVVLTVLSASSCLLSFGCGGEADNQPVSVASDAGATAATDATDAGDAATGASSDASVDDAGKPMVGGGGAGGPMAGSDTHGPSSGTGGVGVPAPEAPD